MPDGALANTFDELLDDLTSLQFNTIELDDIVAVLTSFDIANNLTIYLIVIIVTVLDIASLAWLGCYRAHRRKKLGPRQGTVSEHARRPGRAIVVNSDGAETA